MIVAPPVVGEAEHADVPALDALIGSAYRGAFAREGWTHEADLLGGQRIDPAGIEAILADPAQHLLCAKAGDRLVGCVGISDVGGGRAYLGLLTVAPDEQARGLGRCLLAEGEAAARARFGATHIEMTVIRQRTELIAYYQRRGYTLTGETRPFPYGDARFGVPQTPDLAFVVLEKMLGGPVG